MQRSQVEAVELRHPIDGVWHGKVTSSCLVVDVRSLDVRLEGAEQRVSTLALKAKNSRTRLASPARLEREEVGIEPIAPKRSQWPSNLRSVLTMQRNVSFWERRNCDAISDTSSTHLITHHLFPAVLDNNSSRRSRQRSHRSGWGGARKPRLDSCCAYSPFSFARENSFILKILREKGRNLCKLPLHSFAYALGITLRSF